jgi:uncharacterized protein YrrD
MEIREGASVVTTKDDKVGTVYRIVIDPRTMQITHLVVRKGFLFTDDKVLPMNLVERADGETVVLRSDTGDLDELPDFSEKEYILLDESELARMGDRPPLAPSPMYWYPAYGTMWETAPISPYRPPIREPVRIERNIPDETVTLKEGANIISADRKHIGNLEKVLVEPGSDRATHFVVSQGLILKDKRVLPVLWVNRIEENKIYLGVGSRFIEHLPAYEETHG